MSLADFKRTLPSNRMIFDVRRDPALVARFAADLEGLMRDYALGDDEREAFRAQDLKRMLALGLHPYFITQVTRLFHGSRNNHAGAAVDAYRKALVEDSPRG
ncbi:hypothetical protein [Ramlibacter sp.]|uniref:hypothetical protein n=1 Tax=Ramlibacter sp. TaxID=1917967 RepID=UPI003D0B72C2